MKVLSAEFIRSCREAEQFPRERLPEVAFVGRSNVGKSSLINSLLNRKKLAKVSRTPGKTRMINFFRVSATTPFRTDLYVVDLPGYGYASVAKSVRAQWGPMIEGYLTTRSKLRGIILLVDSRGIEWQDRSTVEWLNTLGQEIVVVTTKVDKLTRSERQKSLTLIRQSLGLSAQAALVPYSSVTHEGRDLLWRELRRLLSAESEKLVK